MDTILYYQTIKLDETFPQMKDLDAHNKNVRGCLCVFWLKSSIANFERCKMWTQSYIIRQLNLPK